MNKAAINYEEEYVRIAIDTIETCIFPGIMNDDHVFIKRHDDIHIFHDHGWDPKYFIQEFLPELQNKFKKYFDIFQYALYEPADKDIYRFNRIHAPSGFMDAFEKLLTKYRLETSKYLLLILTAHLVEYMKELSTYWYTPDGVMRLKQIESDFESFNMLQYRIYQYLKNGSPKIKEVNIKFYGNADLKFEDVFVISKYLLKEHFKLLKFKNDVPLPKKIPSDLPHQNTFYTNFQEKLYKSLDTFLIKEHNIISKDTTYFIRLNFIRDYLLLIGFKFYDKKHNITTDPSKINTQIKSSFHRKKNKKKILPGK